MFGGLIKGLKWMCKKDINYFSKCTLYVSWAVFQIFFAISDANVKEVYSLAHGQKQNV